MPSGIGAITVTPAVASTPPEAEASASRRRSMTFCGGVLLFLVRDFLNRLDEARLTLAVMGIFRSLPASVRKTERCWGGIPNLWLKRVMKRLKLMEGSPHDSADIDLSVVTNGADDSEGSVSTAMHHFPTMNE
ncbi:putative muscle M-line assembly protein unc-89 [Sesbania bispinosa]|nr:putative muscle M-line assembly protein unc-89 [Sesbania bispinosa]